MIQESLTESERASIKIQYKTNRASLKFVETLPETMIVIAIRLITLLAISYLFGLLVAWLFSLFNSSDGGDDFRRDEPDAPQPPDPAKSLEQTKVKKRLIEVDESYYLAEFDLNNKQ